MACRWTANTGGCLIRSVSNSPPCPRRGAGLGSVLSWQLAGNIPSTLVQTSRHGRLCRGLGMHIPVGCVSDSLIAVSRPQSTCVGANQPALGPGPLQAALVCQRCLQGTGGWGCTSRPVVSLAWGVGVSALAYVAGSICSHAQLPREQKGANFTNGHILPLTSMVKTCPRVLDPLPLFEPLFAAMLRA